MSVYTQIMRTSECKPRTTGVSHIVLHHAAMTGSVFALVNLMMPGGRTVSAHAAIKELDIIGVVPHHMRAFSLSSALWDSKAFTAECCNNNTNGWTLSAQTHESIARWVADCCREAGITPHRFGDRKSWTVIGHREVYTIHGASYATACPGGMDLEWITARARVILGLTGATVPAGVVPSTGTGSAPAGGVDIDAKLGVEYTKALQLQLGVGSDGIAGPITTKALQAKVGTGVDGIFGGLSVRALQRFVGAVVDGLWGNETTAKTKLAIDAGRFRSPAAPPPAVPASNLTAPAFPLPAGYYFGPKSGPVQSVSGYYSYREYLRRWQQRMRDRGWAITVDGLYGDETAAVALAFQREKGLAVDGLIGPMTWRSAWTLPVT